MCPVDTVNELDDDSHFGRLLPHRAMFPNFQRPSIDAHRPNVNRSCPFDSTAFGRSIHRLLRHHTAPPADSAPQRPQLTPAVTLRVEPDQPVHQLRIGRVRLLLEPAQDLRPHPLEQVRSCPTSTSTPGRASGRRRRPSTARVRRSGGLPSRSSALSTPARSCGTHGNG